jgi:glycosyltransferase involved in cell wall biosynthesis
MKPLLTIGIPTYNRPTHLIDRTTDLEKLGYLNHPDVEIIIHDNDSKKKGHCRRIKDLKKTVRNLFLIESSPNIGMVNGCYKIINNSNGDWIILLGDDDPILMKCSDLLELIKKNENSDHLFFKTKVNENGKINEISWFPKLKIGNYETRKICAKTGFTTHFAFLGAHCFRKKQNMADIWLKSHARCMFYGHCVMFLENYKKSFYTSKTVAAWTSGNERITKQQNIFRHLEVAALLKNSPSNKIKQFIRLKPLEVVKQGNYPLILHATHPQIDLFNRLSSLKDEKSIKLKEIKLLTLNVNGAIEIFPVKKRLSSKNSFIFIKRSFAYPDSISAAFQCGLKARLHDILKIIAILDLRGPIYLKNKKITFSQLYLTAAGLDQISERKTLLLLLVSVVCFGPEMFNREMILRNALSRPRKGLYKIILEIEKRPRLMLKRLLGEKLYYRCKQKMFGRKHFRRLLAPPQDYPLVHQ